jgi:two-component system sensor histidine kinase MprB
MPLRQRVGLSSAVAVGIAILIAAIVCYLVVRSQLLGQVDSALQQQAALVQNDPRACSGGGLPSLPASAGGGAPIWQVVNSDGAILCSQGHVPLPFTQSVQSIVQNGAGQYISDVNVGGVPLRELVLPVQVSAGFGPGEAAALQLARPLGGVHHILSELRLILFLLCAGGVALAAGLGRMAARRVLAPLAEVAQTAEHITETEDLSSRLRVHADDEVGALATRFNAMIERLQGSRAALDESVRAQRQLVADASHELRTPITSLRTNIEVLLAGDELSEEERRRLLSDVVEQTEELGALVNDLIELARGDLPAGSVEDVRLDRVVEESVARARRNSPGITFQASLVPVIMDGVPERLGRAVNNLLDNAARHSPDGGTVEVIADQRGVVVRDHGTGVDPDDLPYVFDRFYRGKGSRGRQGSGLGLAIVRQVALQHGGSVGVTNAPDGGAIFTMRLPVQPADLEPASPASSGMTSGRPSQARPDAERAEPDGPVAPGIHAGRPQS